MIGNVWRPADAKQGFRGIYRGANGLGRVVRKAKRCYDQVVRLPSLISGLAGTKMGVLNVHSGLQYEQNIVFKLMNIENEVARSASIDDGRMPAARDQHLNHRLPT